MWGANQLRDHTPIQNVMNEVCGGCFLSPAWPPRRLPPDLAHFAHQLGFQVSGVNGLLASICSECLISLRKFFKFRQKSHASHSILTDYLKTLTANEKIDFDYLRREREKLYSSLSYSNTLIVDTGENVNENVICIQHKDVAHISEIRNIPVKNEQDPAFEDKSCSNLENRLSKEALKNENDEIKQEFKDSIEKSLAIESSYMSEDDFIDFEHNDDSSMDVPKKRKKIKKSREEKQKKRKNKLKAKCILGDINDKNSDKILSNRMVLETEQYKVIKLNKEQILAEMEANSKSKRYINSPHKCTLCVKGFNYDDVLQNHMTKHEPKNDYFECDLCHQFLPSAVSMRGHKKSHSTKYQCKKCGVVKASRQHLLEHYMLIHDGAPRTYICNICGKTLTYDFLKRTMFQKHMRIHYPSNKIACDKCGKLFKTIETLRAHMLRHTDIKPYSCDQCFKAFRYASLLYTHKITHLTTRNYYCVECDIKFKTQSNLRLHLRKSLKHVDPNSLKYGCDQCDKRYEDEKSLRRHIEWVHLRQKNYKCSKCEMQFGSPDGLRSHMKKIHDGIRPPPNHICKICNRAFRAKAVLVKHIRVHTGERPYECQECGKKFAQNSTMSTHIKLVHLKMQRHVNRKKPPESTNPTVKKSTEEPPPPPPPVFTYHTSPVENIDSTFFYPISSTQVTQVMRPNPTASFPKYHNDPGEAI